jgi:hypothetical protein
MMTEITDVKHRGDSRHKAMQIVPITTLRVTSQSNKWPDERAREESSNKPQCHFVKLIDSSYQIVNNHDKNPEELQYLYSF